VEPRILEIKWKKRRGFRTAEGRKSTSKWRKEKEREKRERRMSSLLKNKRKVKSNSSEKRRVALNQGYQCR